MPVNVRNRLEAKCSSKISKVKFARETLMVKKIHSRHGAKKKGDKSCLKNITLIEIRTLRGITRFIVKVVIIYHNLRTGNFSATTTIPMMP